MECFVIMGVSGCGKSSIGAAFAAEIEGQFIDGDDLHPDSNRAKMASGQPLTDDDRAPWLMQVGRFLHQSAGPVVIGCSSLKRRYRDTIRQYAGKPVMFLHLDGTRQVLTKRLAARTGHFMPPSLLESQLAALEQLEADEIGFCVDIDQTPQSILTELRDKTRRNQSPQAV